LKSKFFYTFSSFFGALLVAAFFFYFKYKFAEYKFIDFKKITLYTINDIFYPKKDEYTLILFSSKMNDINKLVKKIHSPYPILAVDIFQKRKNYSKIIYTTAGINTIIKLIQQLNIYEVPVAVNIKRYHKLLYKQDSPLKIINEK
jgi:HJR/Mrr/RecB family endonuclease